MPPGRPPGRPKGQKKEPVKRGPRVWFEMSDEQKANLDALAVKANCKAPDIVLRALDYYLELNREETSIVLQMSGGPEVLESKKKALLSYESMEGVSGAAERAGVTLATVRYWLESDEIFRQLSEEATQHCVDKVRGRMYAEAMKPGPASFRDRIAIMNAKDVEFGIIRPQVLVKILGAYQDRVVDCACVLTDDPEKLQHFAAELGRYTSSFINSQTAGPRRRT